MGLQVRDEQVMGRRVLFVAGSGDEAQLSRVAKAIASLIARDEVRVVNVDDLLLANVNASRAFVAHLYNGDAAHRLVLSCTRLTGRKLLRLWGGDDVSIFGDTSQAVVYAYSGSNDDDSVAPVAAGQPGRYL